MLVLRKFANNRAVDGRIELPEVHFNFEIKSPDQRSVFVFFRVKDYFFFLMLRALLFFGIVLRGAASQVDVSNVRNITFESVSAREVKVYTEAAAVAVAEGTERFKEKIVSVPNSPFQSASGRLRKNYQTIDESNTKLSADAPWRHDGKVVVGCALDLRCVSRSRACIETSL